MAYRFYLIIDNVEEPEFPITRLSIDETKGIAEYFYEEKYDEETGELDFSELENYDYYTHEEILEVLNSPEWAPVLNEVSADSVTFTPQRYYLVIPLTTFGVIDPDSENFVGAIAENLQRFTRIEGVKFLDIVRRIEDKALVEVEYNGGQYYAGEGQENFDIRLVEHTRLLPYKQSGLIEEILAYPEPTYDLEDNQLFDSVANYLNLHEEWFDNSENI